MNTDNKWIGISEKWKIDILLSGVAAAIFISLGAINPNFVIGTPLASEYFRFIKEMSLIDRFLITVVLAPILEEAFFRFGLHGTIMTFLERWRVGMNLRIGITVFATSMIFALFHYNFYGQTLLFAYFGAFFFGVVASVLMILRKSMIIPTVLHATINLSIFAGVYCIV